MPKGRIVPVTQEQVVAGKLRNLHERLRLTRQAMRSPTMPLYDPDFPVDAVDGQHALRDGRPYYYWDGAWRPFGGGAWALLRASYASGFTHSPLPYTSFATSDPAVFATSTAGAPSTPSNTTGDQHFLLRKTGMYFIESFAQIGGADGVERSVHIANPSNPAIDETVVHGGGDIHAVTPDGDASSVFTVGLDDLWVGDRMVAIVDADVAVEIGDITIAGGDNTTLNLYAALTYVPAPGGITAVY